MQKEKTALMLAAKRGHLQTVQELLKRGADLEIKDTVMRG